jgi:hypothetical protein
MTLGLGACSVQTLPDDTRPAVTNSCKTDSDCGSNGICKGGVCYSRSGSIDEVLLEIIPEATSPFGTRSFLSMQDGLRRGVSNRAITLPRPVSFAVQVQVNAEDLPEGCGYLRTGKTSIAARIQFTRTGSVGGVSVAGLSSRFTFSVDTEQNSSGFSKDMALAPGFYDIYAQPVSSSNCQIASKWWRGVEVAEDSPTWAPPATLDLPAPLKLAGVVERKNGTLADWQIDVIDPQDGKVISTSSRLGATSEASPLTNFTIYYQPLPFIAPGPAMTGLRRAGAPGPLIRLKPPKDAENTVPIVYFDLEAAAIGGREQINLIMSRLPTSESLVTVTGQVRGASQDGVRSTVKFINTTFHRILGLPAAFGPAVTTDAAGRYTTKLFPGEYQVVVIPEGATDDGSTVPGANADRAWALTQRTRTISTDAMQTLDVTVAPPRIIEGVATAGTSDAPAQGATLEATPVSASSAGVLRAVISPPITPASASALIKDDSGKFKLILDPGDYDFTLKPAAASNFAWWILPSVTVADEAPAQPRLVNAQLLYPVPFDGTIAVMTDRTAQPLRNATVQAYATTRSPHGEIVVTQVGAARTDDMGRYYLALPPGFASLQ